MAVKRTVHRHKKTRGGLSRKHRHTVRKSKPAITVGLIYANWCTHCQHLKPEWKKMKKGMRGTNCHYLEIEDADHHKDRKIAHVNSRLKTGKLEANGYPTIFKVKGGNLDYYGGERNAKSLQQWFKGGSVEQPQPQPQPQPQEPTLMQSMFGGQKGGCDCGNNKGIL
jgi:hypothetical protein